MRPELSNREAMLAYRASIRQYEATLGGGSVPRNSRTFRDTSSIPCTVTSQSGPPPPPEHHANVKQEVSGAASVDKWIEAAAFDETAASPMEHGEVQYQAANQYENRQPAASARFSLHPPAQVEYRGTHPFAHLGYTTCLG